MRWILPRPSSRSKKLRRQSVGEATLLLHCRAYHLEPVTEHCFHPQRKWCFDFCWQEQKLAVEVDGGTWVQGRHNRGSSIEEDMRKINEAVLLGWRVLRFSTGQVTSGEAIDTIRKALQEK